MAKTSGEKILKPETVVKVDDIGDDKDICKLCIENKIDCVFIDCGHLMSCLRCSRNLENCPFCRQTIYKTMKVYKV